jgi:ribosomal protein S18 acetylase RimI-like enzyme
MAALPSIETPPQLRPLNIMRDLPAVSGLVETCFASTLDDEGRRYIQQMRRAGQDNAFLRWAATAVETVSMPLSGFVWEESGEVIGNVSLIPYRWKKRRFYLIANVAVRPDQRRRGIGRYLTRAAMDMARKRGADEIWLQVRDDNPGAIDLYRGLGFAEMTRRTTYQGKPERALPLPESQLAITRRRKRDWSEQQAWLQRLYPEWIEWYQPTPWTLLRPGLGPALFRFFLDSDVRHWAVRKGERLRCMLTWQAMTGLSDRLWVAVPPGADPSALTLLLASVRRAMTWRQSLTLDFPAGECQAAIEAAGFHIHRTLLWMKVVETPLAIQRTSL